MTTNHQNLKLPLADAPNADAFPGPGGKHFLVGFLLRMLMALGNISTIGAVLGFFNPRWWVFEVMSCFRVQYFFCLVPFAFIQAWKGRRAFAAVIGVIWVANLVPLLPYYTHSSPPQNNRHRLIICSMNVHTANKRWDLVIAAVRAAKPDAVLFTEVNTEWVSQLKPLESDFPQHVHHPRSDNFGIAFFTHLPVSRLEIISVVANEIPSIRCEIPFDSGNLTIIGTHPLPPRNYMYTSIRNFQMQELGKLLAGIKGPKILVGDLNTTPWSQTFTQLTTVAGLRDSSLGRGITPTWPRQVWFFGVPIDHCLISPEIEVASRTVGTSVGSDHYPLFLELTLP